MNCGETRDKYTLIIDKVSEDVSEARKRNLAWIHVVFRRDEEF